MLSGARIIGTVQIRSATRLDTEAVLQLLAGIYAEGGYFVGDGPESRRSLSGRLGGDDPNRSLYLVAADEGSVLGWLELHRSPASRLRHVAVLTLAVAPAARRRGVGRALLKSSYDWCRRVGVLKVSLNVRSSNPAAIALYESEGFEIEGCERNQLRLSGAEGGGFEDNLLMGKWLGDETRRS